MDPLSTFRCIETDATSEPGVTVYTVLSSASVRHMLCGEDHGQAVLPPSKTDMGADCPLVEGPVWDRILEAGRRGTCSYFSESSRIGSSARLRRTEHVIYGTFMDRTTAAIERLPPGSVPRSPGHTELSFRREPDIDVRRYPHVMGGFFNTYNVVPNVVRIWNDPYDIPMYNLKKGCAQLLFMLVTMPERCTDDEFRLLTFLGTLLRAEFAYRLLVELSCFEVSGALPRKYDRYVTVIRGKMSDARRAGIRATLEGTPNFTQKKLLARFRMICSEHGWDADFPLPLYLRDWACRLQNPTASAAVARDIRDSAASFAASAAHYGFVPSLDAELLDQVMAASDWSQELPTAITPGRTSFGCILFLVEATIFDVFCALRLRTFLSQYPSRGSVWTFGEYHAISLLDVCYMRRFGAKSLYEASIRHLSALRAPAGRVVAHDTAPHSLRWLVCDAPNWVQTLVAELLAPAHHGLCTESACGI